MPPGVRAMRRTAEGVGRLVRVLRGGPSPAVATGRGRVANRVLWVAAVWVLAGACSDGHPASPAGSQAATQADPVEVWNARCADTGVAGRLYASVSLNRYEAVLTEVELCPVRVERLAEPTPLYGIAAGGGVVAVSGGHHLEGVYEEMGLPAGPGRLSLYDDGEVVDLPGLGSPRGGRVTVSRDGVLVFVDLRGEERRFTRWDPQTHESETVARGDQLGWPAWGPQGRLAITETREDGSTVVAVLGSEGSRVEHDTDLSRVRKVIWWPGDLAVLSPFGTGAECCEPEPPRERAIIMDLDTGETIRRLPRGWQGVAWSPDGEALLVTRGLAVGVLRLDEEEITRLGELPDGAVHDAAWIE